jgi:hypothetical protein
MGEERDGEEIDVCADDEVLTARVEQDVQESGTVPQLAADSAGNIPQLRGHFPGGLEHEPGQGKYFFHVSVRAERGQQIAVELRDAASPPKRIRAEKENSHQLPANRV